MSKNNHKLDFINIGAPRSGTTWLFENLNKHPDICIPKEKDLRFFVKRYWGFKHKKTQNFRGIEWYIEKFTACPKNKIKGEVATLYLYDEKSASEIYEHFGKIKILVCLRDPIERLWSDYRRSLHKYNLPGLQETLETYPKYRDAGLYHHHLSKFIEIFGEDNILIIPFQKIKMQPREILKDVYNFLEVETQYKSSILSKKINKINKQILLDKLTHYSQEKLLFSFFLRKLISLKITKKIIYYIEYVIPDRNQTINKNTTNKLFEYYKKDYYALSEFYGGDLGFDTMKKIDEEKR